MGGAILPLGVILAIALGIRKAMAKKEADAMDDEIKRPPPRSSLPGARPPPRSSLPGGTSRNIIRRPPPRSSLPGADDSPIKGVSMVAWKRFVGLAGTGKVGSIDPYYRLGIFRMSMRRLVDLGVANHLRRGAWPPPPLKDSKAVWMADFIGPTYTMKGFLADPKLQYRLFTESMQDFARLIGRSYSSAIGKTYEGERATLSGLLAVARLAGPKGLADWLSSSKTRAKFAQTTSSYKRFNGIF